MIRPPAGSTLAADSPASCSARELATPAWPSMRVSHTRRPAAAASSAVRDGHAFTGQSF